MDEANRAEAHRVANHAETHARRFGHNLRRVSALILVHEQFAHQLAPPYGADILRAAVVFLHATLEDALRGIARFYLLEASPEVLNTIPLATLTTSKAEKFYLGQLAAFRGQMVEDVLRASIDRYLDRTTFNRSGDIATLLTALAIDLDIARPFFGELDSLMERRHRIVHQADTLDSISHTTPSLGSLEASQVQRWLEAVDGLFEAIVPTIATNRIVRIVERDVAHSRQPDDSVQS
jgi:hypothetical protein